MDLFDHDLYRQNKTYLQLAGFWPGQKLWYRRIFRSILVLLFITFEITQYMKLKNSEINVAIITKMFMTALMGLSYFVKFAAFWIFIDDLIGLMSHVKRDWARLMSEAEVKILRASTVVGKKFATKYRYCVHISVAFYIFVPTLPAVYNIFLPENDSLPLGFPFEAGYPFDTDKYYAIVIIHMAMITCVAHVVAIGIDLLQMTYLQHACGMFDVIGHRLRHVFDGINRSNRDSDIYRKNIIDAVNCHRDVLQFVEIINKCYGWCWLIQLSIFAAVNSMIMFQVVLLYDQLYETTANILFLTVITLFIIFNIFRAQKLIDHSAIISSDIYNTPWYKASPKLQKLLITILRKTNTPSVIYAGKFYTLSLESLGSIVQLTVSYFTVLHSVQKKV